jgi:ureidoacrylate peracid hydrolase
MVPPPAAPSRRLAALRGHLIPAVPAGGSATREPGAPFFDTTAQVLRQAPLVPEESCVVVIDMQNFGCDRNGYYGKKMTGPEHNYWWDTTEKETTPNIARVITAAREKGIEVMYTCIESLTADGRERGIDYKLSGQFVPKGSWDAAVLPAIAPIGDEIVLSKGSSSLWVSTNVGYVLRCTSARQPPARCPSQSVAAPPSSPSHILMQLHHPHSKYLLFVWGLFVSASICSAMGIKQVVVVGALTDQCCESAIRDACDDNFLVTQVTDACATFSQARHEASLQSIKGYCRQRTAEELVAEIEGLAPSAYLNTDKSMLGTAAMQR